MLTLQVLAGSGLSMVRYSWKPEPTRPSAKYQVFATGPSVEETGDGDGDGLAGVGVGVALPELPLSTSPSWSANSSANQTLLLLSMARPSWGCLFTVGVA